MEYRCPLRFLFGTYNIAYVARLARFVQTKHVFVPMFKMPRYRKRRKRGPFKKIKTAQGVATFLGVLGPDEMGAVQKAAEDRKSPDVHPGAFRDLATGTKAQLIHGVYAEEIAKRRGDPIGGGLLDAISDVGSWMWNTAQSVLPPIQIASGVYHGVANNVAAMNHKNTISDHTRQVADFVKLAYSDDADKPSEVAGFTRDTSFDENTYIDVWESPATDHVIVAVRGTKVDSMDDLGQDSQILTQGKPQDLISSDLKAIVSKYGDSSLEIAGHSLGASLIGAAFKSDQSLLDKFDRVDLYNPGSSPLATSNVVNSLSNSDQVHWYMNSADLVGWGALAQNTLPPENLIMNGPQGINPMTNHAIDQWTSAAKK